MAKQGIVENIDWSSILMYAILVIVGIAFIYDTTYSATDPSFFRLGTSYGKQTIFFGLSIIAAMFILVFDSKFYTSFAFIIYGLIMLLLVAVLVFGVEIKGSKSWFKFGSIAFQPAELAKFATTLALAKYLSGYNVNLTKLKAKIKAISIILLPIVLILLQGDVGSMLVFSSLVFLLHREGLESSFLIIGFGAIILVSNNPEYLSELGQLIGNNNMAAIHLSHAVGGDILLGFISAVAFATILAVVSGLTLAGASSISHDLYANAFLKGKQDEKKEMFVSKISTVFLGILAMFLGIIFEEQNVAFMVGLAFAIAASTNFPILILAIYWKNLTTRGAIVGGSAGLFSSILLVILGPVIWVDIFNFSSPIFPYKYPALFSMSITFLGIFIFSKFDTTKSSFLEKNLFDRQFMRSQTGVGIDKIITH